MLEDKAGLTAVLARHVIAGSSIMVGSQEYGATDIIIIIINTRQGIYS